MLVDHVSSPVVLSRERLAAVAGVGACRVYAVVLARLVVLVVDVPIKMRLRAESLITTWMAALVWPIVVPLVVAGMER